MNPCFFIALTCKYIYGSSKISTGVWTSHFFHPALLSSFPDLPYFLPLLLSSWSLSSSYKAIAPSQSGRSPACTWPRLTQTICTERQNKERESLISIMEAMRIMPVFYLKGRTLAEGRSRVDAELRWIWLCRVFFRLLLQRCCSDHLQALMLVSVSNDSVCLLLWRLTLLSYLKGIFTPELHRTSEFSSAALVLHSWSGKNWLDILGWNEVMIND